MLCICTWMCIEFNVEILICGHLQCMQYKVQTIGIGSFENLSPTGYTLQVGIITSSHEYDISLY